jgi:AcrR family transcriptional regulator
MPAPDAPPASPPPAANASRRRTRRPPGARADEIVDTALPMFATRGFRGTTLAAIAAHIGITDAGLLHHFPTKSALLRAALDRHTANQLELFRDVLAPGGIEAVRRLGGWGEVMERTPHLLGLEIALTTEGLEPSSELHEFYTVRYKRLRRWLVRILREGIEAGDIRPDVDPEHETACYVALLDGLRLQWFFAEGRMSIADRVRTYVDQLVARIEMPA